MERVSTMLNSTMITLCIEITDRLVSGMVMYWTAMIYAMYVILGVNLVLVVKMSLITSSPSSSYFNVMATVGPAASFCRKGRCCRTQDDSDCTAGTHVSGKRYNVL